MREREKLTKRRIRRKKMSGEERDTKEIRELEVESHTQNQTANIGMRLENE